MAKTKKKTHRPLSYYTKQLLRIMDEYAAAHGCTEVDPIEAARWAIREKKWDEPRQFSSAL